MATQTDHSKRYAKAFLRALENFDTTALQKIQKELEEVSIFSKEPALSFFLNPVFHMDEKKAVVEDLFSKHTFSEQTKQFILTLLSLDELDSVESVAKHFADALNEKNEETRISISTAYPLEKAEEEKIRSTFEKTVGKTVILDVTVNPELIGGIRAQVGGVVYDSSIQGHLLRLQKEFTV